MPKVSIIVPVYNVEKYIEKCLNTLMTQTLSDIEIIIVDDGSKDSSKRIIEKFVKIYPQIIKYYYKENGGLSSARNFGIQYAQGEYIAFLDSDDYIEPTMYEEMYNTAKKENADMVECDFIWEYPKKQVLDRGVIYNGKKDALEKARVVAWNKLIKREIIEKQKIEFPYGLRYEDVEFFYKLLPYLNNISFVKKYFIHYVQRDNSIVNTQNSKTKDIFKVLNNVLEFYKNEGYYEDFKEQLEYTFTRILLCSSLKRMCKIGNKDERKKALDETWNILNTKFPNWKKNKLLKKKSLKNLYMRSMSRFTFNVYCAILHII